MNTRDGALNVSKGKRSLSVLVLLTMLGLSMAATRDHWLSLLARPLSTVDQHAEDRHDHAEAPEGIVLSESAKMSLGLDLSPIFLKEYWRSLSVPAEVMEEPGHCEQGVSATIHGIILRIHAFHGQTVRAGDPYLICDRRVNCWQRHNPDCSRLCRKSNWSKLN